MTNYLLYLLAYAAILSLLKGLAWRLRRTKPGVRNRVATIGHIWALPVYVVWWFFPALHSLITGSALYVERVRSEGNSLHLHVIWRRNGQRPEKLPLVSNSQENEADIQPEA